MKMIRFGSRDSELAVIQSRLIMEQLTVPCELITMKTTGDRILDRTLDKIGGKGLFVKELDRALQTGQVDFTIHSLKDMPMEQSDDFPILVYSKREDVRDALILPDRVHTLDLSKPIGCASARRRIQLLRLFPNAQIMPIRGNIQTRLRKLDTGEYGALVLAAAGLHRLGLHNRISRYFSTDEILPAAGQGIIAVQGHKNSQSILSSLDDIASRSCALAERSFTRALNGGCSSPVAAYAQIKDGNRLHIRAMYVNESQTIIRFGEIDGTPGQAETLGYTLAQRLGE